MQPRPLIALVFLGSTAIQAAELAVMTTDQQGAPLSRAVVTLSSPALPAQPHNGKAEVDQVNTQFVPHILVVPVDTSVSFPNSDNTRHQVYSFSAVKRFSTNLFSGREAEPVQFDQPGIVPIGCNIHDRMHAYIYVTAAPRYAITDDQGIARFGDLPAGNYRVEALHPWQVQEGIAEHSLTITATEARVEASLNLGRIGPDPRAEREQKYNPLIRSNPFAR